MLAPASVQELYELTVEAFNIADKYRNPVVILGDGYLGQMMEAVEFRDEEPIVDVDKDWATCGHGMKREHNVTTSIYIDPNVLEAHNNKLQTKYLKIKEKETRAQVVNCDDADVIVVAYGTVARVVKNVIKDAEKLGIKVGLIRPITLWPFPTEVFEKYATVPKGFLTVEMSAGQMVEDVRLAINGKNTVDFHGRMGGNVPTQKDILEKVRQIAERK